MKYADGSKVFSHNDHKNGYAKGGRGTTAVVLDPKTLKEVKEQYFPYNKIDDLKNYLNAIKPGFIVALSTTDEPFQYWRGAAKNGVNAALTSMGMPAPAKGADPEFRGAYAGFGLSGCTARKNCPSWAGGSYAKRFGKPATYTAKMCPGVCRV